MTVRNVENVSTTRRATAKENDMAVFTEFLALLFAGNWLGAFIWLLQQIAGG